MRCSTLIALGLPALVGCSTAPGLVIDAAAPRDGGADAAPTADAAPATDGGLSCDVTPAPAGLVPLTGELVPLDADGGMPVPAQSGGDPTGVWRIEHVTIFTGPGTGSMYDPSTSSIAGTAWIVADGTELRMELALDVTLAGTAAGTIRRHQVTDIRGTYTTNGAMLSLAPECVAPPPTMTSATGLDTQFTAGPSRGTLVLTTNGMLGENTIVLTGTRMPT